MLLLVLLTPTIGGHLQEKGDTQKTLDNLL